MLRDFFSYYRPHRALFLLDFGCAVLSGLLELGFPLAVKAFVDLLLPRGDWPLIMLAGFGLLVVYVVNTGLMAIVTYWGHVLGINIETEMRRRAFDHLQKLSFRFYDEQKTGHLVARVTKDLEEIGEVAHHGPEDLFIAIMTFLGAFALMLMVHVELALLTALIVPLAGFVVARYGGAHDPQLAALSSAGSAPSMPGWRRISAASAWCRPSPTRTTSERCSPATTQPLPRHQARRLPHHGGEPGAELSGHAAGPARGDAGRHLVRRAGQPQHGGFVGFLLLVGVFYRPLDKIASVHRDLSEGDRRLPALSGAARDGARHRRPAGRRRRRGALAGDIRLRGRELRLCARAPGAERAST